MTWNRAGDTFVKAYVETKEGVTYSNQVSFQTLEGMAVLNTGEVTEITPFSALVSGEVTSEGGDRVMMKGFCWDTATNVILERALGFTENGTGAGAFEGRLTDLKPGLSYFVSAYAMTTVDTTYGESRSFLTLATRTTVITAPVTEITITSARCGGEVTSQGGDTVLARGVCWDTLNTVSLEQKAGLTNDGYGAGVFISLLSPLLPGKIYYARAYACTKTDTSYGSVKVIVTINGAASLTTNEMSSITASSATCGGFIADDGGSPVLARGVCWNTVPEPTIYNDKTVDGAGTGSFTSQLEGLQPNTTYYVRSYATNAVRTTYGDQRVFSTLSMPVALTTEEADNIRATSAILGGNITNDGGNTIAMRGVYWSTNHILSHEGTKITIGSGKGSFSATLFGLLPSTLYYIRAFAVNASGTYLGNQLTFTTKSGIPKVTTSGVSDITPLSASSGGTVTDDGGAPITGRGVCWSMDPSPDMNDHVTSNGAATGSFTSLVTGLMPENVYYLRAWVQTDYGISYGSQVSFNTPGGEPIVSTLPVTGISSPYAICGGNILETWGRSVTMRGVIWGTSPGLDVYNKEGITDEGPGSGSYVSFLSGLADNVYYYVRAYAMSGFGIGYGPERIFLSEAADTGKFTDTRDGQQYGWVRIGNQVWMAENLDIGTQINGNSEQSNNGVIEKYYYNNDPALGSIYGGLYQWYEMINNPAGSPGQGICPSGWHVPSHEEWKTLETAIGMSPEVADLLGMRGAGQGPELKEGGSSGFDALMGGKRKPDGTFSNVGTYTTFWTSDSYTRTLSTQFDEIYSGAGEAVTSGFSVRCVRN